jgi:hypothetical protein
VNASAAAALCAAALAAAACDQGKGRLVDSLEEVRTRSSDATDGSRPVIGPSDPPYSDRVIFPSGLRLEGLSGNGPLAESYPDEEGGLFPFGRERRVHYRPVEFFIDVETLSQALRQQQVSENFKLVEYVRIPERNGDLSIYVDPEIAFYAQELRYAWGGPLVLSSTFRSPEYNAEIGGALFSRHMYGDAVDIRAPSQQAAQDLFNLAKFLDVSFLEPASLTIEGRANPWIHIDTRGWPLNTPESR